MKFCNKDRVKRTLDNLFRSSCFLSKQQKSKKRIEIMRQYILFYTILLLMLFEGNTYAQNYNKVVDSISIELEQLYPSTKFSYRIINNSILIISLAIDKNIAANVSHSKVIADNIAKIANKHLHDSKVIIVGVAYRVRRTFLFFLSYEYSDSTCFFKVNS